MNYLLQKGHVQLIIPSLSIIFVAIPSSMRIVPTLTADTLLEGNTTCPNQLVNFTCQTTGSLAWRSDEYIGGGGRQLTFGVHDIIGSRHPINSSIYAELVSIDPDNSITSKFHIEASLGSNVTCTATDYHQTSWIYFKILGKSLSISNKVARDLWQHKHYCPRDTPSDSGRFTAYSLVPRPSKGLGTRLFYCHKSLSPCSAAQRH